jgi:RNA polymerase sigma factor (sigma-70 family)
MLIEAPKKNYSLPLLNNPPFYTEAELVELLQQRDQKAFSVLYERYSTSLYGVILKIIPDEKEAEDILQVTFIKIWKGISTYSKEKARIYTWMLNIAKNTAIDQVRSKQGKINLKNAQSVQASQIANSQHAVHVNYDAIGLSKVLATLSEEQQTILNLVYYEGYTQEEIAEKLNLPLGTVKTKVRQSLLKLRKLMG